MKKIAAVTGASGTVGKQIVKLLLDADWHVRVLTRSNLFINSSQLTVISSDINDEHGLRILLKGVNAIFHCAAELNDEKIMYATNVEGTCNLIKLIGKHKRVLFLSPQFRWSNWANFYSLCYRNNTL